MPYPETQEQVRVKQPNRTSTFSAFSLSPTIMSEADPETSLENVILSHERPIIVHNPNYTPQPASWTSKPWVPKLLMALLVALILVITLAIVLVVLAVMGYLGKGKVDVVSVVQPGPTTTAAVARMTGAAHDVKISEGGRVRKRVGIIICELALGWSLVYLFRMLEEREKAGHEIRERRNEEKIKR